MWLTNIIRGVSISCAADVGNMFDIVNVASWRMIGNKLPQTCLSTQPSLFPCQPRRPACLRNNRSSFTTTHRLDITLNSFKRTSEKKAQHVSLPPAPQLHKVIKDCACRMIRMSHDGETDRGKDMFVIFLLNPFFFLLSENSIWKQNETLFKHHCIGGKNMTVHRADVCITSENTSLPLCLLHPFWHHSHIMCARVATGHFFSSDHVSELGNT